jgi:hypothetical protein
MFTIIWHDINSPTRKVVRTFTDQKSADHVLTEIDNDPFLILDSAEGWDE